MPESYNQENNEIMAKHLTALQDKLSQAQRTKKVIMTYGLPASGKTRWTLEHIKNNPDTIRVNKDSLRLMIYGEPYKKEWEPFICDVRDTIIIMALNKGYNVVVDDTNFHAKHREDIERIAQTHFATVEIKDFTHVPLEVCIERDRQRDASVGEEAIRRMHDTYLAKEKHPFSSPEDTHEYTSKQGWDLIPKDVAQEEQQS